MADITVTLDGVSVIPDRINDTQTVFDVKASTFAGELQVLGSQVNTFSSQANSLKADVNAARDKALQWADANENVVVETGKYSAKHYSIKADDSRAKAEQWANNGEDVVVETGAYSAKHHAIKADGHRVTALSAAAAAQAAAGLPAIAGKAGYVLTVKSDASGVEFGAGGGHHVFNITGTFAKGDLIASSPDGHLRPYKSYRAGGLSGGVELDTYSWGYDIRSLKELEPGKFAVLWSHGGVGGGMRLAVINNRGAAPTKGPTVVLDEYIAIGRVAPLVWTGTRLICLYFKNQTTLHIKSFSLSGDTLTAAASYSEDISLSGLQSYIGGVGVDPNSGSLCVSCSEGQDCFLYPVTVSGDTFNVITEKAYDLSYTVIGTYLSTLAAADPTGGRILMGYGPANNNGWVVAVTVSSAGDITAGSPVAVAGGSNYSIGGFYSASKGEVFISGRLGFWASGTGTTINASDSISLPATNPFMQGSWNDADQQLIGTQGSAHEIVQTQVFDYGANTYRQYIGYTSIDYSAIAYDSNLGNGNCLVVASRDLGDHQLLAARFTSPLYDGGVFAGVAAQAGADEPAAVAMSGAMLEGSGFLSQGEPGAAVPLVNSAPNGADVIVDAIPNVQIFSDTAMRIMWP